MKITLFNGSPKGKRGNTQVMVDSFAEGAEAAGAEVEKVLLSKHEIKHCTGCLSCWTRTPGKCVLKDDMSPLIDIYMASNIVVIATPLYVDNVSGMTKVFMDRLMPIVDPHFVDDADGETSHVKGDRVYPDLVAMSCCGFPEQTQFQVLELLFKRVARNMQGNLVAEIYKAQGNILTIEHPMLGPVVKTYVDNLKKAAAEIVSNRSVSPDLMSELNKPFMPKEMYVEGANRNWDKLIAKFKSKASE